MQNASSRRTATTFIASTHSVYTWRENADGDGRIGQARSSSGGAPLARPRRPLRHQAQAETAGTVISAGDVGALAGSAACPVEGQLRGAIPVGKQGRGSSI